MMASPCTAQARLHIDHFPQTPALPKPAGIAFLASAVLPGAGQKYLGLDRWAPYAALEAWSWVTYANHKSRGNSLERRYRDLAWLVARRISVGVRRDTTFPYYEAMSEFRESGSFDLDPGVAGIQPELDTLTFNGAQWRRAKALFLPGGLELPPGSPAYDSAVAYYQRVAIPPGYEWSWGDSNLEQQQFSRLIGESDDALRGATRTLGLILANHMVSAIDALVTARLKAAAGGHQLRLGSELVPAGESWMFIASVRFSPGK